MKKKAKCALIILSTLFLLIAAFFAVYFFCFERFAVVSDPAWGYLLPSSERLSLRLELALSGKRLVIVNATAQDLSDASSFTPMLLSLNAPTVLLGPIASQCAIDFDLDVSSLLEASVVYGMWKKQCSLFDATIISDVDAGWKEASQTIAQTLKTMAQNVGVVYDSLGTSAYQAIETEISGSSLLSYLYDGESHLYYSNTLSDMNQKQVVLALCPHLSGFEQFFSSGVSGVGEEANSVSWIVDYRYAKIVPKQQLYGIVLPNLSGLARALVESGALKKSGQVYSLEYKYEAK